MLTLTFLFYSSKSQNNKSRIPCLRVYVENRIAKHAETEKYHALNRRPTSKCERKVAQRSACHNHSHFLVRGKHHSDRSLWQAYLTWLLRRWRGQAHTRDIRKTAACLGRLGLLGTLGWLGWNHLLAQASPTHFCAPSASSAADLHVTRPSNPGVRVHLTCYYLLSN